MTAESSEEQAVLQFMYQIPIGVAELAPNGDLGMANPHAMQVLLQLDASSLNLFDILESRAPEIRLLVDEFDADQGVVIENYRVDFGYRGPDAANPLVLALTIKRLSRAKSILTLQDVSRTAVVEAAARHSEQRLKLLTDHVRDFAVVDVDAQGKISGWSASARRLFGYEASDAVDNSVELLYRGATTRELPVALDRARRVGWTRIDGWWTRKGGESFQGSAAVGILEGNEGAVVGFALVVQDQSDSVPDEDKALPDDVDPETGALSMASFERAAPAMYEAWFTHQRPMSVAALDFDSLSRLRASGDDVKTVLQTVVGNVREQTLPSHTLVRSHADGFLLIMPEMDIGPARRTVERIRVIQEQEVIDVQTTLTKVLLNAGLASVEPGDADLYEAVQRAQAAAEQAKRRGRNQIVLNRGGARPRRVAV